MQVTSRARPLRTIVLNPRPVAHSHWFDRFPRTYQFLRSAELTLLPHPESPAYVRGTVPHAILSSLAAPSRKLMPVRDLEPAHIRELRERLYAARQTGGKLHVVGLVDTDSPYGTRRVLEHTIRLLHGATTPVIVHTLAWDPTPSELRYAEAEVATLCRDNVTRGLHHDLHAGHRSSGIDGDVFAPEDQILILNHELTDLPRRIDGIWAPGVPMHHLPYMHRAHTMHRDCLDQRQMVTGAATRADYLDAYFGHDLHHAYHERITVPSSTELLEMLISPHYGYGVHPAHTVVVLDEVASPTFDWLLMTYLKQSHETDWQFAMLQPSAVTGSFLFTKHTVDPVYGGGFA